MGDLAFVVAVGWAGAITAATAAAAVHPPALQTALYRTAQARVKLKQHAAAVADLRALLALEPVPGRAVPAGAAKLLQKLEAKLLVAGGRAASEPAVERAGRSS